MSSAQRGVPVSLLSRLFVKKRTDRKGSFAATSRSAKTYAAVELICVPGEACSAAQSCSGKRLLISEAPLLPVPGCDRPRCGCRYRKFADRRTETRRASALDMPTTIDNFGHAGRDRRTGKGRRSTDAGIR